MTPIDRARLERLLCEAHSRDAVESRRPSWMLADDLAVALRDLIAWADEAVALLDEAREPVEFAALGAEELVSVRAELWLAKWPEKDPHA